MSELGSEVFYFDKSDARLLVGHPAYEAAIESGSHPLDIVPLAEILNSPESEINAEEHTNRASVDTWTRQDYITYGHWLAERVCVRPQGPYVNSVIIRNAGVLGIGPVIKRFEAASRFGSLSNYYAELQEHHLYQRNLYKDWSLQQTLDYLRDVSDAAGGLRPTVPLIDEHAKLGKGPSARVIVATMGKSLFELQEAIGFPFIQSWTENDYIDWGVRFMLANDGMLPKARLLDLLSQHDRGPAAKTIYLKFESFKEYKLLVKDRYMETLEHTAKMQAENSAMVHALLEQGLVPASIIDDTEPVQSAERVAKYQVASKLLGYVPAREHTRIAAADTASFVRLIQRRNRAISAAEIEMTAIDLGVYDIIWPMSFDIEPLRVAKYINA